MTGPGVWSAAAGAGPAELVLVHGTLDRSAGMLKLSRRLDADWRVTRYDRRGYGRSLGVGPPFGVDAQVADLVGLIGSLDRGGRPVVLFGHSFGGNVALAVADRHPELVRAVIVYESPLSWTDWWPADSAGGAAAVVADRPEDAAEAFMRRLIGDARWDRLPESTRRARRAEGPAMLAELADLRLRAPWHPDRIRVPVLTMFGEHGRPHHQRAMRWVAEAVPDGRTHEVTGAHHFGPSTHPDAVATLVNEFVTA